MEIAIDPKTNQLIFEVDKKDIGDANRLKELVKSEGWKVLKEYYDTGREKLIHLIKECSNSRTKKELCSEHGARLDGFDQCSAMAYDVIARVEELLKIQKKLSEAEHEGNDE